MSDNQGNAGAISRNASNNDRIGDGAKENYTEYQIKNEKGSFSLDKNGNPIARPSGTAKPGDEERVPGLSAYLDLPPSPGRPSRPPYFANLYQSAATVREKLSAEQ